MTLQTAFYILLYVFLAIFVATAVLSIASLPGWIKIPAEFRKKLFTALLLEVVGAAMSFFAAGAKLATSSHTTRVDAEFYTQHSPGWTWEFGRWSTRMTFIDEHHKDGGLDLIAKTYVGNDQIYQWRNLEPIKVLSDGSVDFLAQQTILENVKSVLGPSAPDPGIYKVRFRLRPTISLTGTWQTEPRKPGAIGANGEIGAIYASGVRLSSGPGW